MNLSAEQTNILVPIIVAAIAAIAGISSSYLTYYFTIRSKKTEAIFRFKEERYTNLLTLLKGFVGNSSSGDLKRGFFEEEHKSWLYSSDDLVKATNDMVKLISDANGKQPDPKKGRKLIGNIVLEMRRDLLGKTSLAAEDFYFWEVID